MPQKTWIQEAGQSILSDNLAHRYKKSTGLRNQRLFGRKIWMQLKCRMTVLLDIT